MCGRFTLLAQRKDMEARFDIEEIIGVPSEISSNYNIAPTQNVVVVVKKPKIQLTIMRWGLIPSWTKERKVSNPNINARAESLAETASYRTPFQSQRCIVIASGFYEWRKQGKTRIPMYIHLKSKELMGFAGVYDNWIAPSGESIISCSIITTTANELMAPIHNRMPVILPKEQEKIWLNADSTLEVLKTLLRPYSAASMEAYPISSKVNKIANNGSDLIIPVSSSSLQNYFGKK